MPDNGENHEIRQRTNAREAEIAFETTTLLGKETAELEGALTSPDHHGRKTKRSMARNEGGSSKNKPPIP
jgi:hypothetical protein